MPQRHLGAILAAGLALTTLPAAAQVIPDNFVGGRTSDLAALCAAGPSDPQVVSAVNYCHGFLLGVGQFHAEATREGARIRPFFCLPNPRPTVASITSGFVAWAAANPQFAGTPAVEGVVRYATSAFPCPPRPAASRRGR
jgi:hypothetical protein